VRKLTWRIILSTANLLGAMIQSVLGLREYDAFRRQLVHSDAIFPYIPPAQLISYCINAPSFVFTNLLGNLPVWRAFWAGKGLAGYWFHHVSITFYLALFLFWWWVGWRVDVKPRLRNRSALAGVLGYGFGASLSLALTYVGIDILRATGFASDSGGRPIAISIVLWGVGLLCYFGFMLLSSRCQRGPVPPVA